MIPTYPAPALHAHTVSYLNRKFAAVDSVCLEGALTTGFAFCLYDTIDAVNLLHLSGRILTNNTLHFFHAETRLSDTVLCVDSD